jgi:hypothetical protein
VNTAPEKSVDDGGAASVAVERGSIAIAFTLSMPNVGSWNGKWSSAGKLFVRVKRFTSKAGKLKAAEILARQSYFYNFGDGWGASVSVRRVDAAEARKLTRQSAGFYGYDWMIDRIISHGRIVADHQLAIEAKGGPQQ